MYYAEQPVPLLYHTSILAERKAYYSVRNFVQEGLIFALPVALSQLISFKT